MIWPTQPGPRPGGLHGPQRRLPRGRRRRALLVVVASLAVLLLVVGRVEGIRVADERWAEGMVGHCLRGADKNGMLADPYTEEKCGTGDSTFKVLAALDRAVPEQEYSRLASSACPGEFYATVSRSYGDYTLCVTLDVEPGDCLAQPPLWPYGAVNHAAQAGPAKVSCTNSGPDRVDRVTRIVPNGDGMAACGQDYYSSDNPSSSICLDMVHPEMIDGSYG